MMHVRVCIIYNMVVVVIKTTPENKYIQAFTNIQRQDGIKQVAKK